MQALLQADVPGGRHVSQLAWLVSLAFVICCAWRLARFNVHGMAPVGGLRYFVGMPTPAAAGMIAAVVHALKFPMDDWRWSVPWLALVLALAFLMVSSVRYPSFKDIPWGKRQHSLMIVVGALLIWSIVVYSEIVLHLDRRRLLRHWLHALRRPPRSPPPGFPSRLTCLSAMNPCA